MVIFLADILTYEIFPSLWESLWTVSWLTHFFTFVGLAHRILKLFLPLGGITAECLIRKCGQILVFHLTRVTNWCSEIRHGRLHIWSADTCHSWPDQWRWWVQYKRHQGSKCVQICGFSPKRSSAVYEFLHQFYLCVPHFAGIVDGRSHQK